MTTSCISSRTSAFADGAPRRRLCGAALRGAVALVLASALAAPSHGQSKTLGAESVGLIQDILAPHRDGATPPAGVDPDTYRRALEILKREKLLGGERPAKAATGILGQLGNAVGLGSQAPKAIAEIGALRDALVRGDEAAAKRAIQAAYAKLGWKPPDGEALERIHQAAREAAGREADKPETFEVKKPDYDVVFVNGRGSGKAEIEVVMRPGPDGKPARVVFKGDVKARPDSSGRELELRAEPDKVKTYRSSDMERIRASLNGIWIDQDGVVWDISGSGDQIRLTQKSASYQGRDYEGTFNLGRIEAAFAVTRPEHIGAHIPLQVRQKLAGMGLAFKIRLTFDDEKNVLDGTWSSRHVTYNPRNPDEAPEVHSPYDTRLTLKRSDKRKRDVAGRYPEEGP